MLPKFCLAVFLGLAFSSSAPAQITCSGCDSPELVISKSTVFANGATLAVTVTATPGGCIPVSVTGIFSCEAEPCSFDISWSYSGAAPDEEVSVCWGRYRVDDPTIREKNCPVFDQKSPSTGTESGTAQATAAGGVVCTQLPYYFGLTVGTSSVEVTAKCTACG